MTREQAEKSTILRALVGSTAHGLNVQDSIEDRDEMGVCLEPITRALGFSEFEQFIYRSAAEREGRHDAPSSAGDLDLILYSLRKFCRLALKGNPTIIGLLFVEPLHATPLGHQLRELAPAFVSRKAGGAFLGYLQAQRQRLLGERGSKGVRRPALEDAYGFDTKYAMHMCRLGIQGVELMRTGRVTYPVPEPERSWLRDLRVGKVSEQEALTRAGEMERELKDSWDMSALPKDPDTAKVEQWMCRVYLEHWKSTDDWSRDYPSLLVQSA
jgi:predicted nucleotidyltransferase